MGDPSRKTRTVGRTGVAEVVVAWLVPRAGKRAGQIFPLFESNVIGGSRDCHVLLDDPTISGRHVEIAWRAGTWVMTDLTSTNGSWVNGSRVGSGERHVGLADNDVLKLGDLEATFKCV
jgi:pSer/pThr/pTyr-binding forkhead associated (FHA) protein